MSDHSKIEWTDATWNPVRGCTKISTGCKNCYAETFAERWRGIPGHPYEKGFDLRLVPEKLDDPLSWKKPKRIFVNSMSDLFHKEVPFAYVDQVFATAYNAHWHTYQILTKRSDRQRMYFECAKRKELVALASWRMLAEREPEKAELVTPHDIYDDMTWPLPNVWLGVSVENQKYADERIPNLLKTPAAIRFLSCEPLLEPVDLSRYLHPGRCKSIGPESYQGRCGLPEGHDGGHTLLVPTGMPWFGLGELGFVIVGGESGPKARPMHPDWARSLRDECVAACVPFFFKQWGAWVPFYDRDKDDPDWRRVPKESPSVCRINLAGGQGFHGDRVIYFSKVGKKGAGRLLDGRTWDEFPQPAEASP